MEQIKIIQLPKIEDVRGNLSIIEEYNHIPFKIKRTYWIYDVPRGEFRGSQVFKETKELIVALSGSFDVVLHESQYGKRFSMNRSYYAIYVPRMIWRKIQKFSTYSSVLILASTEFS